MRIHPRYFNLFMIVVAIMTAIIIVYATFSYRQNRVEVFREHMMQVDTLDRVGFCRFSGQDSLSLERFAGRYVLLDFWAEWSEPSLESHKYLSGLSTAFQDTLQVIAASVRQDSAIVRAYRQAHDYPFEFVEGTSFYNRMKIPGVPAQVLIDPQGVVIGTFVGFTDSTRYDSLRTLIRNE